MVKLDKDKAVPISSVTEIRQNFENKHPELMKLKNVEIYFQSQLPNDLCLMAGELPDDLYFQFFTIGDKVGFTVTDQNSQYLDPNDGLRIIEEGSNCVFSEEVGVNFLKSYH